MLTSGDRVLAASAWGSSPEIARTKAYAALNSITFPGMGCRRNIGALGPRPPGRFDKRWMGRVGVVPSYSPSLASVPASIGVSSSVAFAFLVRKPHSKPMERLNKYRL
ncbi:MAG: hypothetical protein LBF74_06555 [Treponema sp.]|nr:hypothetical protein [Treponema sp.]